jgi:sRNA-binding regulator protein Hfq
MAKSWVAAGKKRYYLSLDRKAVEEFQAVAKKMNMAPNALSALCEEAVIKTVDLLRGVQLRGSLSLTDLFTMVGKETQAIMEEEVAIAKESVQPAVGQEAVKKGKAAAEPVHKQRGKGV